jgi:hypothetical protein
MLEVMKMFDIDNPSDDKAKLIDAVACSFASCQTEGEYQVVKMCIVEFFSAINIPDDEAVDILLSAAPEDNQNGIASSSKFAASFGLASWRVSAIGSKPSA